MTTVAAPVTASRLRDLARMDRAFHSAMAAALAVIVFVGFAPTFYLRQSSLEPLPWLAVVHGVVFSAWMVAYLLQAALIATRRRERHKTLGYVFMGLGGAMLLLGLKTALESVRRGAGASPDLDPRVFMVIPVFDLILFAGFLWGGYYWRRSVETHKRLMLLATIDAAGPAIARMAQHASSPLFSENFPMWAFAGMMLLITVGCAYDAYSRRRIHPAYLWGAVILTASGPIRFAIGATPAWMSLVDRLLRCC